MEAISSELQGAHAVEIASEERNMQEVMSCRIYHEAGYSDIVDHRQFSNSGQRWSSYQQKKTENTEN